MRLIQLIAAWLLLFQPCCAQTLTIKSFEAIEAKSVHVEQLTDSVAVMLEEPQPGLKTGAYVTIASDFKWAVPSYDGLQFKETGRPGEWITFAKPGLYRILLGEFDPERGPRLTYHDLVIKGATQPPPPTGGDLASLTKVSKESADQLNDAPTRKSLAMAYSTSLDAIAGKPYVEAIATVQRNRQVALRMHMKGNDANWNGWLKAVDAELGKVVPAGDADKYAAAIAAVARGLDETGGK